MSSHFILINIRQQILITVQPNPSWQLSLAQLSPSLFILFTEENILSRESGLPSFISNTYLIKALVVIVDDEFGVVIGLFNKNWSPMIYFKIKIEYNIAYQLHS